METKREWLYCYACHNVQRDRRAYRDHLLRVHGEVALWGSDIPVRLAPYGDVTNHGKAQLHYPGIG